MSQQPSQNAFAMKPHAHHQTRFSAWTVATSSIALLLGGCAVGPDFQQPNLVPPAAFHSTAKASTNTRSDTSFADLKWQDVFKDPQLSAYIEEALIANWDIKIAASRLLEAEAAMGVERSRFFPSIFGAGDLYNTRSSENGPSGARPNSERSYGDAQVGISSYEIDLWGNIRYANTAARARYLQSEQAQHTVRQTLVSQVAASYLNLLELDYELQIAEESLATRQQSLTLTTAREKGGVAAMQDVVQAQILVYSAQSSMVSIKRERDLQENTLCILLGRNPTTLARGATFSDQRFSSSVPAGLPSSLIDRRPDIRSAEQGLVEANANIGQAKAAFYPQVTLTGSYGYQSVSSSDLFKSASRDWQFGPAVSLPIFTGGRLKSNLKITEAQYETALSSYQQTVQNAFKEVSDALVNYQRTREFASSQTLLTQSNREAAELANIRYQGGVTSYLEVLYNEQELFSAELTLAQAELSELLSVVQLYRALGGGWGGK
ncbi:MAG: multidrug efflux system outer membrane protein [Yoonia sp.]|jgi:multidrug efflux system outer membrane protein